jgi:hypothetical protein
MSLTSRDAEQMLLHIAYPVTGCQTKLQIDEEQKMYALLCLCGSFHDVSVLLRCRVEPMQRQSSAAKALANNILGVRQRRMLMVPPS